MLSFSETQNKNALAVLIVGAVNNIAQTTSATGALLKLAAANILPYHYILGRQVRLITIHVEIAMPIRPVGLPFPIVCRICASNAHQTHNAQAALLTVIRQVTLVRAAQIIPAAPPI